MGQVLVGVLAPSLLCPHGREGVLVSLSLIGTLVLLDWDPIPMTSFTLYLLTGPVSRHCHTGVRALT